MMINHVTQCHSGTTSLTNDLKIKCEFTTVSLKNSQSTLKQVEHLMLSAMILSLQSNENSQRSTSMICIENAIILHQKMLFMQQLKTDRSIRLEQLLKTTLLGFSKSIMREDSKLKTHLKKMLLLVFTLLEQQDSSMKMSLSQSFMQMLTK